MPRYWIPKHVYVCVANDVCVWLDVRGHGEYYETTDEQNEPLGRLIKDWRIGDEAKRGAQQSTEMELCAIADKLLSSGLVTRNAGRAKVAQQATLKSPQRSLISDDGQMRPVVKWHHVLRFVAACLLAFISFRLISLRCALWAIERMKARRAPAGGDMNTEGVRELVRVFTRLRLFLYTAKSNCLYDSITLMRFLGAYRIYPVLVIGVTARPFSAHSWIQEGSTVFNGELEFNKGFTPILTI